jgi:hypothetical protein
MHQRPRPIVAPAPNILRDHLPGRDIMGQQAPGTATAQDIKDGVQDVPCGILLGSAPRLGGGHRGCEQRPFLVREVGRVRCSGCHASDGHPPSWSIASFLNTLLEVMSQPGRGFRFAGYILQRGQGGPLAPIGPAKKLCVQTMMPPYGIAIRPPRGPSQASWGCNLLHGGASPAVQAS